MYAVSEDSEKLYCQHTQSMDVDEEISGKFETFLFANISIKILFFGLYKSIKGSSG